MNEIDEQLEDDLSDLLELDLELRLTVALRLASGEGCECPEYLVRRRGVLMEEVFKKARAENKNPADVFHAFAIRLHARHEEVEDG